jgi:hypothetical protein
MFADITPHNAARGVTLEADVTLLDCVYIINVKKLSV